MKLICVGLMGLLEKRRFRNFLVFANNYDAADPKTQKGVYIACISIVKEVYIYS